MNGLCLDHCFSWPCNNIAEDDETSWHETVWPEDFAVFMMPAIMWPVCGCNCMRYIKNVWASQHVWGLQGPQVLTLPIAYMAPSMFSESVFGLCGLFVAHKASKGIRKFWVSTLLVIQEILLRHNLLGNTIRLVILTLHHRWTDHTGDDYCKCLLKRLDILSSMQAHFAIVYAVRGPIFLHVAGVIHVKESIVQVIGCLFNLTHPIVYGYQIASCSYVFVTNHGDCRCEYIRHIVACV